MTSRLPTDSRLPAAIAIAVALTAMLVRPESAVVWRKERLDGLAADGSTAFFTLARVRDVSHAAAGFIPCLVFARLMTRGTKVTAETDPAAAARRMPWVEIALAVAVELVGLGCSSLRERMPPRHDQTPG